MDSKQDKINSSRIVFGISQIALLLILSSCAATSSNSEHLLDGRVSQEQFIDSGTIILSHRTPSAEDTVAFIDPSLEESPANKPQIFAPLLGYFPPTQAYIPADNETWIELNSQSKVLAIFKGSEKIREIPAEGEISLPSGNYIIRHKQQDPVWYAPDSYFHTRELALPTPGDRLRYRRGALGQYALYPTPAFPIHSAPFWTSEVGGLRLAPEDLATVYEMVAIGTPITIR